MYATVADFVAYFGQAEAIELSNLDGDPAATAINNSIVEFNLRMATAEIDGLLPQSTLVKVKIDNLMRLCLDIARYKLDKNRQREDVRLRYEDALRQLEVIRTHPDIADDATPVGEEDTSPSSSIEFKRASQIFTQESLSNFGRWR